MHLFFSNVKPMLWRLVSDKYDDLGQSPDPYIMSKETEENIGEETANGRATVSTGAGKVSSECIRPLIVLQGRGM